MLFSEAAMAAPKPILAWATKPFAVGLAARQQDPGKPAGSGVKSQLAFAFS